MTMKQAAGIAAKTSRRITSAVGAVVALVLVTACSRQPSGTGAAATNAAVEAQQKPAETNEAVAAQLRAAKELGIPIEKTLPKSGIVLRLIPTGTFTMGSLKSEQDAAVESASACEHEDVSKWVANETQHKVTLTKAFYIGKYEVTQGQWRKVMGSNEPMHKDTSDAAPVESLSWHDCTNFMAKLAALEGMPEGSCRLPTEAQWEYACRAGTETAFCYGDDLDSSMANCNGRAPFGRGKKGEHRSTTVAVGSFKQNAWGLYDMHGNVWEWCADWYGQYAGDATDPCGAATGSRRVLRGGCWFLGARCCRSADRSGYNPALTDGYFGFRAAVLAGQ